MHNNFKIIRVYLPIEWSYPIGDDTNSGLAIVYMRFIAAFRSLDMLDSIVAIFISSSIETVYICNKMVTSGVTFLGKTGSPVVKLTCL